ncbi:MAG: YbhB/YbcL family Raf kinase inhibitor-like protein [Candidatus Omnitrophota bacterium]
MRLTSPAFEDGASIPERFTGEGADVNPPLEISRWPEGTKSMVLIVDDPDAPRGTWVHWVVYDIVPVSRIDEASVPGTEGMNSSRGTKYRGPYPPSGTHRYFFKLYALDAMLLLPAGIDLPTLQKAMTGHSIGKAELMGTYQRRSQ